MIVKLFYKSVPNATSFLFDSGAETILVRPQYVLVCFDNNKIIEKSHDASSFKVMDLNECYFWNKSESHLKDWMTPD